MSIELQLTTGDEEWTFNLAEAVVPSPGDALTIDNPDGDPREFRVVSRRITLNEGGTVGSVRGGIAVEPA
jgi:hypothetical protein